MHALPASLGCAVLCLVQQPRNSKPKAARHANEKIESGRQKVFPPNLSDILTLDELLSKAQLPALPGNDFLKAAGGQAATGGG